VFGWRAVLDLADQAQEVARKIGKSDKDNSLQGINPILTYMLGHGLAGQRWSWYADAVQATQCPSGLYYQPGMSRLR
jgi:hypothetical protein